MIANSHRPFFLRVFLVLMTVFGIVGLSTADLTGKPGDKKKKKSDEPFLPEAKPVQARFILGTSVEIELDAATPRLAPVRFLIREGPKNGTLSAIRPHPKDLYKALVTYTHNPASGMLVDRFTYACSVEEGPWSAPGTVSLTGMRADPKIEIMGLTTFGRVLPGFRGTARLTLKNTGIAPFASDIQWQAPWMGPPRVELGIGEQKEFLLTVQPTAPGTLIWETEIQPGQPLSKLRLYVECSQMFVVAPGHIKLHFDAVSGSRRGKVGVANSTDLPMKFVIEPPKRIGVNRELEVPAKQSAELEISLDPSDVLPFSGELWVISEPYRERVLIDAAPEPAQAVLVAPVSGSIDFGVAPRGKVTRSTVTLKNVGGEPAILAAQGVPPFRVPEKDGAVSIAPGQERQVAVEALSDQAGKFTGSIAFSGSGGKIAINTRLTVTDPNTAQPVRPKSVENPHSLRTPVGKVPVWTAAEGVKAGEVKPEALTAKPDEEPKTPSGDGGEKRALTDKQSIMFGYLSNFGMPTPPQFINTQLKVIEGINLIQQGRDELTLEWKNPEPKPEHYLIEAGFLVRNEPTGRWLKAWRPMPNTEVVKGEEGKHTVRLKKLMPNGRHELRVVSVDAEGKVSQPSDIYFFSTLPPWKMPSWTWQAVAVIALLIFSYVYFRLKRREWGI
jgi:hypothetical protein